MLELLYFPPKQFSPRFGDNIFTVNVNNFEREEAFQCGLAAPIVYYLVVVSRGRNMYIVRRRFSEFEALLNYLKAKYPSTKQAFPNLPPKTWISVSGDDAFLQKRCEALQACLNDILLTMHIEKLLTDEKLQEFLDFTKSIWWNDIGCA